MIESIRDAVMIYQAKCDCCGKVHGLSFTAADASRCAERDGWLWNGEEHWCPECLKHLAERVP